MSAITQLDFYKTGHAPQYPDGTNDVYSNMTGRSDRLFTGSKHWDKKIVWFGLQRYVKEFLIKEFNETFFHLPKAKAIAKYKRRMDTALGPDAVNTDQIGRLHDLGYLPLVIKSLPEGSRVNIKVPVFTVRATIDEFFWLTNFLETVDSCELWKPTTVATIAYEYRRILDDYAVRTGSPKEFVQFQAHDFSMRGMSNRQDAANCGMGHLLPFTGTDTVCAIDAVEDYYNGNAEIELIGTSVPATEHSVMCMGGKDDEIGTFKRLITELYPCGIVSIVSDTWNLWTVVRPDGGYLAQLKDVILARPVNALGLSKVVIRPDSGDPETILCGVNIKQAASVVEAAEDLVQRVREETEHGEPGEDTPSGIYEIGGKYFNVTAEIEWNRFDKQYYYIESGYIKSSVEVELTPEQKGVVRCLWEIFGGTITSTGHKLLDSHIGAIYGDSITLARCESILARLDKMGFASACVVFGIGSYTYQYITRDTLGFAMKATYGEVKGVGRELEKDPVTDSGVKKSAKGLLRVEKEGDNFVLYDQQTKEQEAAGELKVVFYNGELMIDDTFANIRARLGAL